MPGTMGYPTFVAGTDADGVDRAFDEIVRALAGNDICFMFGAGMSAECKAPIGAELSVQLLRLFFPKEGTNPPTDERLKQLAWEYPFEATVEAIEKNINYQRAALTDALTRVLINKDYPLSKAHEDFVAICSWWGVPVPDQIFTTNFDLLLEKAIGVDRTVTISEKNASDIEKVKRKGLLPIVHLHGVLNGDYQITESDVYTQEFRVTHAALHSDLFNAKAVVFVGYSMTDPDFRRIYMEYRDQWKTRHQNKEKTTYVVGPAHDEFSYRFGKKVWATRGAEWIPLTAGDFFGKLKGLMAIHAEADTLEELKTKYGRADENAVEDLLKTTTEILHITRAEALVFLREARSHFGG